MEIFNLKRIFNHDYFVFHFKLTLIELNKKLCGKNISILLHAQCQNKIPSSCSRSQRSCSTTSFHLMLAPNPFSSSILTLSIHKLIHLNLFKILVFPTLNCPYRGITNTAHAQTKARDPSLSYYISNI